MSSPVDHAPPLRWWNHAWRLVVCALFSLFGFAVTVSNHMVDDWKYPTPDQVLLDIALGVLCFVLVCFRRRRPVLIAVLTTIGTAFSTLAAGPGVLAFTSLATRRRWRESIPLLVLGVLAATFYRWWVPAPDDVTYPVLIIAMTVGSIAVMAWGFYIGSRRELLWTLEDRAARAEAENELRADKARGDERARIAREMHDVLAHRISQVSMHAGALSYREDLSTEQMRESAGSIQQMANAALADLRNVLGVLRDPETGELLNRPQPTHEQIPALAAEAREAGMHIDLMMDLTEPESLDTLSGRTAYRLVQEGLTNAAKHAPGSLVRIRLTGSAESGLSVQVRNPRGFARSVPEVPGSGLGLVGVAERMERAGGTVTHGVQGSEFVLSGWLPWTS